MKLDLCWKTCDQKIVNYFAGISPDKTISEGKFLTQLFFKTDCPLTNDIFKNHFQTVYKNKQHYKMIKDCMINVSEYDKNRNISRIYNLSDQTRNNAFVYFMQNKISLYYEQTPPQTVPANSKKVNNVMEKLSNEKIQLSVRTLDSLLKEASDQGRILAPRVVSDGYNVVKMISRAHPYTDNDKIINIDRQLTVGKTGRIYEKNGSVQNLSRLSKKINYNLTDVYNYDIRSCALAALSIYCNKLEIDTTAIDEYVANPNAKNEYAQKIDIGVDTWKTCLLSCIFGANTDGLGKIAQIILEDVGTARMDETYRKFKEIGSPLLETIEKWLNAVTDYAKSQINEDGLLVNSVGCKIPLYNRNNVLDSRKLSSFYLQGLEASFIYDVILNSEDRFKLLSYEFDGLVTQGKIPNHIIEKCKQSSGFTNVILEIKEF